MKYYIVIVTNSHSWYTKGMMYKVKDSIIPELYRLHDRKHQYIRKEDVAIAREL